jgi:transcriptional regulator with XRE-family HTH domain
MYKGKIIQSLRKLKRISQHQVANKLGITQQAYSKLEKQEWIDNDKIDQVLSVLKSSRKELETLKKITTNS